MMPFSPVQATLTTSSRPFDLGGLNTFMSLKIPLFNSFSQTQETKLAILQVLGIMCLEEDLESGKWQSDFVFCCLWKTG